MEISSFYVKTIGAFMQEGTEPLLVLGVRASDGQFRCSTNIAIRKKLQQDPAFIENYLAAIKDALTKLANTPLDDLQLR